MKKFILLMTLISSSMALAAISPKWGAECGLTDAKDDSWKELKSYNLNSASEEELAKLPTLVKQQVIVAAKYFASDDPSVKIYGTNDAVEFLRRSDGPYITHYLVGGKRFTEVLSFPGDNPVGLVFAYGSLHVVAKNGDNDIMCRE